MIVNRFKIGEEVEFYKSYESIMDGRKGFVVSFDTSFLGVYYEVEVNGKIFKNIREDELR